MAVVVALLSMGCTPESGTRSDDGAETTQGAHDMGGRPERITIVPDDYHVPYAGTAQDGRRFFLSEELFDQEAGFVGLFLWNADGSFDEVQIEKIARPDGLPPGQAAPAGADEALATKLAVLGDYRLEPIVVEPFLQVVDGVTFGWRVEEYDGEFAVNIEPGNFIAYYEPWDGLEYDT